MKKRPQLIHIVGTENENRIADIIFVNGLGGESFETWHPKGKKEANNSWLNWLGEDIRNIGIWSVAYDMESFIGKESNNLLAAQAINIVELLDSHEIGKRPLIFIAHSMGGLLVKQLLRIAWDFGNFFWRNIVLQTKGIVFLSTPHSAVNIVNWLKYNRSKLDSNISIEDLEVIGLRLQELNKSYQNHPQLKKIPIIVFCENKKTSGVMIVNQDISEPGMKGVAPIPLDENHITIAKPQSKQSPLYLKAKKFIKECLSNPQSLSPRFSRDTKFQFIKTLDLKANDKLTTFASQTIDRDTLIEFQSESIIEYKVDLETQLSVQHLKQASTFQEISEIFKKSIGIFQGDHYTNLLDEHYTLSEEGFDLFGALRISVKSFIKKLRKNESREEKKYLSDTLYWIAKDELTTFASQIIYRDTLIDFQSESIIENEVDLENQLSVRIEEQASILRKISKIVKDPHYTNLTNKYYILGDYGFDLKSWYYENIKYFFKLINTKSKDKLTTSAFQTVKRYTLIDFPSESIIGDEVELRIQLVVQIPEQTSRLQKVNITTDIEDEIVRLDVHITAENFSMKQRRKKLLIPVSSYSEEIVFQLTPIELGEQIVEIEFFHEGSRVGYAIAKTNVKGLN